MVWEGKGVEISSTRALTVRQLFNNVLAYGITTFLRCAPLIPYNYYGIDVCCVVFFSPAFIEAEYKKQRANCETSTCVFESNVAHTLYSHFMQCNKEMVMLLFITYSIHSSPSPNRGSD